MNIIKPKLIIFDWNDTIVYNDKNNLIKLLPNALKVIRKLYKMNIYISIISNTYQDFLNKTIKRFQLEKYILNAIGIRGNIDFRKPSKEVVDYAIIGSGIVDLNIDNIWIIGDSLQDLYTSYNANIRGVIFGEKLLNEILYKEGLEKNKKVFYFKNHTELFKKLEEIENENT